MFRRIGLGDESILLRAPLVVIHAVEDPGHRAGALPQHAIQAKTKFRRLNLLAVFSAHGGYVVGKNQRALQKAHLAPELRFVYGEQVPGKHEQRQNVRWKESLIADVVDGKYRGHILEHRITGIAASQQDGHQGRLPVVAMENVRRAQDLRGLQDRPRVQRKTLGVVGVIARGCAIQSVTLEERRVIDKIKLHARLLASIQDGAEAVLVIERY